MSESPQDDKSALGKLGRQEILTALMIVIFGTFSVTVGVILILVFLHPDILDKITISGDIDLGRFIDRFDELLMAFIALLGVSIGIKAKK